MLSENENEPATFTNPWRTPPLVGASFQRSCLEHLQRNAFIEFGRQGQVWTFALGERVKGMLGE